MTNVHPATATSGFVEANGVKLHYLDYGSEGKPPIVCLHGGAAHAHWYDFVAPGLNADHHVLSLDLRGHGDSAHADASTYNWQTFAADVNAFVEKLDLRDFVLIGHSMGGMVSLVYASTYPGRMSRLVIVDTIMLMPMERVMKMHEFGARPPKPYATQQDLVARYRLEASESRIAPPEVVERMAMYSGRQAPDGTWQHKADRSVYSSFRQIDGVPLWEKVKVPALLIKSERSKRYPPEAVAEIRARAPQVQIAQVPASDHHITLDNPQGFVEVVREFLRN